MEKYKIVKETDSVITWYGVYKKVLFWWNIETYCKTLESAKEYIKYNKFKTIKETVYKSWK